MLATKKHLEDEAEYRRDGDKALHQRIEWLEDRLRLLTEYLGVVEVRKHIARFEKKGGPENHA